MVLLRLGVKVFSREQLQGASSSTDRDGLGRAKPQFRDREIDSFLVVLDSPEETNLGELAHIICEKWKKRRPNAEPLEIKKLLDDENDDYDLDAELTVADVFVNQGKARQDASDQRATVRVIQKPSQYTPVRLPSVTHDWDALAEDAERQRQIKKEIIKKEMNQFPTIYEDPKDAFRFELARNRTTSSAGSMHDSLMRPRDIPVFSVERDEIPGSPPHLDKQIAQQQLQRRQRTASVFAPTPTHKRAESQELGDLHCKESKSSILKTHPLFAKSSSSQVRAPQTISEEETDPLHAPLQSDVGVEQNRPNKSEIMEIVIDESEPEYINEGLETLERAATTTRATTQVVLDDLSSGPAHAGISNPRGNVSGSTNADALQDNALRKRKLSPETLKPNKEPRRQEPKSTQAVEDTSAHSLTKAEASSSTPRRRDRAPSFSGAGRRLGLGECSPRAQPKSGLGLGITSSPSSKPSAVRAPSPSSPSRAQRTPSKLATPMKGGPTTLCKGTSADEQPERRGTVSSPHNVDLIVTKSGPAPASTQRGSSGTSKKQEAVRDTKVADQSPMIPKPGAKENTKQAVFDEFEAKAWVAEARQTLEKATKQGCDHNGIPLLKAVLNTWDALQKPNPNGRRKNEASAKREQRNKFKDLRQQVEKSGLLKSLLAASSKTKSLQPTKKVEPMRTTPAGSKSATKANGTPTPQPTQGGSVPRVQSSLTSTPARSTQAKNGSTTPTKLDLTGSSSGSDSESDSNSDSSSESEEDNSPPPSTQNVTHRPNASTPFTSKSPPLSRLPPTTVTWSHARGVPQATHSSLKELKERRQKELAEQQRARELEASKHLQSKAKPVIPGADQDSESEEESESESESESDSDSGSGSD
ncbi:uncharacterized protein BO97DRAFT_443383 [Aspergillus homomorphus CBS 101889]|uniref:Nucleolar protein Dnt1-like N-terminal domain-containing protein n=1 Tax=Aspergillus homomorphus (strain CBS 101889) TaxID=1450537 RepID=A0A395HVL7_ASPHC|nr:hypothetical protein BO97DRAFT_443383 [Aspergillus homomorphus CBS 101889]RAL11972.1 hypothetical protein BO97DRAFT_443383 [Aspergillus homomorphus CBS 101889]